MTGPTMVYDGGIDIILGLSEDLAMYVFNKRSFFTMLVVLLSSVFSTQSATAYQSRRAPDVQSEICANLDVKSGPLAPVGLELAQLYCEYEACQQAAQESCDWASFQSSSPLLRIINSPMGALVIVDAVADANIETLQADLEALGMQQVFAFGTTVSGQLPISVIADMASLDSLRFARPAAVAQVGSEISPENVIIPTQPENVVIPTQSEAVAVQVMTATTPGESATDVLAPDNQVGALQEENDAVAPPQTVSVEPEQQVPVQARERSNGMAYSSVLLAALILIGFVFVVWIIRRRLSTSV